MPGQSFTAREALSICTISGPTQRYAFKCDGNIDTFNVLAANDMEKTEIREKMLSVSVARD